MSEIVERRGGNYMLDVLYPLVLIGFFALTVGFVRLAEKV